MKQQSIVFFDLEAAGAASQTQHVFQWAYACEQQHKKGEELGGLLETLREARWLCAHNLLAHDSRYLPTYPETSSFLAPGQQAIDTLYLSALLFAEHPYHRLVKDYRMDSLHSDPLEDVGLLQNLFWDCVEAWSRLPLPLKDIYAWLLQSHVGWQGFLSWVAQDIPNWEIKQGAQLIQSYFKGRACQQWDKINAWLTQESAVVAYGLALMQTAGLPSILPPWLVQQYPQLATLLQRWRGTPCATSDCTYCQQALNPHLHLKKWFDYSHFRLYDGVPLQEQMVYGALEGESFLAVLPTGGGKSMTFQLPALMQGEAIRALTVVISPLQSLMKDQIDNLVQRFEIAGAVSLNGSLTATERKLAIEAVMSGEASLLYIAPEALRSNTVLRLLQERTIARFVIDEAHCFSEWGQDFRVDYLYLARFIELLQRKKRLKHPIPISCFTATAKHAVQEDILTYFKERLQLNLKVFQTTARRTNLQFQVFSATREEKFTQLCNILSERLGPKIVYASTTAQVEKLANQLQQSGYSAKAYHGQMAADLKKANMDDFMQGYLEVMVATSAFGMGVDKDNVSMVIHYEISDSLEDYIQEAGRAGRSEDIDAACYILFDEADLNRHFMLLNSHQLNQKEINQVWAGLKKSKQVAFSLSTLEIAKAAGWDVEQKNLDTRVKTAISALEEADLLVREQNATLLLAGHFTSMPVTEANQRIAASPLLSETDQIQAKRIYQYLQSRVHTQDVQDFRFDWMCEHLGLDSQDGHRLLNALRQSGLIRTQIQQEARIFKGRTARTSTKLRLQKLLTLEQAWLNLCDYSEVGTFPHSMGVSLKSLNSRLKNEGIDSSLETLNQILSELWPSNHVRKERRDRSNQEFLLTFSQSWEQLYALRMQQQARLQSVVDFLESLPPLPTEKSEVGEHTVGFALEDLHQALQSSLFGHTLTLHQVDGLLLLLHRLKVIQLENGAALFHTRLKLERTGSNRQQFTQAHYQQLKTFYSHKVEQIHFVGEYARRMLDNHQGALQFVEDYFHLPYEKFLKQYFPSREQQVSLRQPITPKRFQQIFGELSEEQLTIIKDSDHDRILVAAGPGSGKTRILVHKVAALLMLEEVKPEQFLMLTYSRPAAQEMRQRLSELLGYKPYYLDIATFHSYAFQLLEAQGDVSQLDKIIEQATLAILDDTLPHRARLEQKSVILVDEYQDISEREYRFLKAILEVAGEAGQPRVIVVGDDDQNIYDFRGSSTRFMREFASDFGAHRYFLSTNYRSAANLVDFSNQFVRRFKERIKEGHTLLPVRADIGELQCIGYENGQFFEPVIQHIQATHVSGSAAVLCATNEEALLLTTLLQQAGLPAQLLMEMPQFKLSALLELQLFSYYLRQQLHQEHGLISPERWQECRNKVLSLCQRSQSLPLFERVLKLFLATQERIFYADWLHWLHEMRWEDCYPEAETGQILVATMHKAKGKEFDHVYVYLDRFNLSEPGKERVLYVAMTRARHRLFIHGRQELIQAMAPEYPSQMYTHPFTAPRSLVLQLGLKDIFLGAAKTQQRAFLRLVAGCKLEIAAVGLMREPRTGAEIRLSRRSQEHWQKLRSQGYQPVSAQLGFIAVWWDEQEQKQYRIPLPEIRWEK